jgi:crotonobetainyl-CoA:carnitine CoA-transferase CaiB-like acyl-CoA transferase
MSGFMSTNGNAGEPALRCGPPITDLVAGLYAAYGVVNALRARDQSGCGQKVDSTMLGGILSMFAYLTSDYLATGELPLRTGNDHPITSPYGLFSASDGEIAVAPSTDEIMRRFLGMLELEHLLTDARFRTNNLRILNRQTLNTLISERLRLDTQATWIRRLNQGGVPCGKVQNIGEALADPQIVHQQMILEIEHPGHGPVRMVGFPVKLSGSPCIVRYPAPKHGEHTQEIMEELGLT